MAELPVHRCPADGCSEVLEFPYLWCATHWKYVPRHLQVKSKEALIEALQKGTNYRRHQALAREAIDIVNGKIAKKNAA